MLPRLALASLFLLVLASVASAQHNHGSMMTEDPPMPPFNATGDEPMSYALFPENKGYFYTHVVFMVLAFWVLMPLGKSSLTSLFVSRSNEPKKGVMFGIARSSLHVPTQILAFIVAMFGYFFGKLYGHSVPHFYKGNVHHTMGWIILLLLMAQLAVGVVRKIANAVGRAQDAQYDRLESVHLVNRSASSSSSTSSQHSEVTLHNNNNNNNGNDNHHDENDDEYKNKNSEDVIMSPIDLDEEDPVMMHSADEKPSIVNHVYDKISPYIPNVVKRVFVTMAYNPFTKTVCRYWHTILGRIFVVLIFTQTLSGLVVYHGVCR